MRGTGVRCPGTPSYHRSTPDLRPRGSCLGRATVRSLPAHPKRQDDPCHRRKARSDCRRQHGPRPRSRDDLLRTAWRICEPLPSPDKRLRKPSEEFRQRPIAARRDHRFRQCLRRASGNRLGLVKSGVVKPLPWRFRKKVASLWKRTSGGCATKPARHHRRCKFRRWASRKSRCVLFTQPLQFLGQSLDVGVAYAALSQRFAKAEYVVGVRPERAGGRGNDWRHRVDGRVGNVLRA